MSFFWVALYHKNQIKYKKKIGGIWGKSEGIWGMNSGYNSGHCSAVFDPGFKYWGIGYWPGWSSVTMLYI